MKDAWMGGEGKDWQAKRIEEHRKSIEEGKGLSGIIFDQIADVWSGNWRGDAKKPDDEAKPGDGERPEKR